MARRIVLTMVALIGVLLVTTVIPLGMLTTAREGASFRENTVLSARALAAVAEESLTDHRISPALASAIARARKAGEQVWVYNAGGHLVMGTGPASRPSAPGTSPAGPRAAGTTAVQSGGQLRVAVSVQSVLGGSPAGTVVLARSTSELNERLRVLWAWLSAVAAAGLMAGAIVARTFTRWVSRPLSALDAAAHQLGGGALGTRSEEAHGPPEVRRLARNFNTMAARLEALVHGHRAMMADVSHQLRTPLTALRLRMDVLAQDTDEATAAELAGAQEEVARLSRLVDGLLAVARAENVVAEPVPVAVDEVIRDRASAWRPVAEERAVALTTACHGPVWASLGDGHLEQVMDNLLANALDVVPPGGHVRVSARITGQGARVTVEDDGPGMSSRQQEAAFRRFTATSPGGAGLGLAIVHRLVTSNGGSAALSDTPGGGLTVILDLQADQPERSRRAGAASSERPVIPYQI